MKNLIGEKNAIFFFHLFLQMDGLENFAWIYFRDSRVFLVKVFVSFWIILGEFCSFVPPYFIIVCQLSKF